MSSHHICASCTVILGSPAEIGEALSLNLIPALIGILLYGIYVVLFGLSIYIFRKKLMPGRIYVVATVVFFTLATVSLSLDLTFRFIAPIPATIFLEQPAIESFFQSSNIQSIQSVPSYTFFIAGLLSDCILIHRCYRLWNGRKLVIFFPVLGIIGSVAIWIWSEKEFGGIQEGQAVAANFTVFWFSCITLAQNLLLMGLIGGRLWWLYLKMKPIWVAESTNASRRLFGIVLESGVLIPILVGIELSTRMIAPVGLTQGVGIASALIIIRIGLGVDALDSHPQATARDAESQVDILYQMTEPYSQQ